jgi:hypothetical protein
MECPVCGSSNVTASHRRGTEKLFRYLLPRAPYRCKDCWSRFWRTENPFKTGASKLGAFAVLLLAAAVVSLPFWGPARNVSEKDSETPEESYTLPVPTHRSAQRSYDGDAGRPAPAPRPETDDPANYPEGSPEPTYARAGPPDPAGDPETAADFPSLTPMAGAPAETEPGAETPTGEVPPIAAGPAETAEAGASGPSEISETGAADSSETTADTDATQSAEMAERAEAETPDPEAAAEAEGPEPSAPETAAATEAAPESTEAAETAAVSPETEAPSSAAGEPPPAPKGSRTLTALAPRSVDGRFELVASAGGPVKETNIFPLSDPPKLVIDLAGKWDRKVKSPVAVDGPLVKRVRLGNHPEFLRLVLDLAQTGSRSGPVGHEFVPTAEGFRLRLFPEGGS